MSSALPLRLPSRPLLLALAIAAAPFTVITPANAQTTAAVSAQIRFDIAPGHMTDALNRFASTAGITLSFDPDAISNLHSDGLQGSFSVDEALHRLLSGSGLQAQRTTSGAYLVVPAPVKTEKVGPRLSSIKVSAAAVNAGTSSEGYKATNTAGIGPLGERSLQDTPFSVSVMSEELIENTGTGSFDQLFKMNPVVQNNAPFTVFGYPTMAIRGFAQSTGVVDGVKLSSYTYGLSTEELERVEIFNGLTGFMYGAGNVGGTANYVLKRPKYERLTNVALGTYANQQGYVHVDVSDKIDEDGTFAYRTNLLYSDGETAKNGQNIERKLISGALDWNLSENFLLQFDAAHTTLRIDKPDTRFYSAGITYWPDAFDNSETYTPDWNYNNTETDRAGVKASLKVNDNISLRSAYVYKEDERDFIINYPIFSETGWSLYNPGKTAPYTVLSQGAYVYLDSAFNTGSVEHKLTVGFSGDNSEQKNHIKSSVSDSTFVVPKNLTLQQLMDMEMPAGLLAKDYGGRYIANETENTNLMIGDTITFNEQWSSIVGVNQSTIKTKNFNTAGVVTSEYDESAVTPTVSVIYKPIADVSLYVSAIEGLEAGSIVPNDPNIYNNAGEILDPFASKQYEFGAKYSITENILFSSALFRIEKVNSYDEMTSNGKITRNQDGEQIHQGLEFTLTGKLTDNLTIIAGGTAMDLGVEKATNPNLEGKEPIGVATEMAKIYAEYAVTQLPGFTVTAGAYYTGGKYKDSMNLQAIDSYTLYDAGARYQTTISGIPTSFNLNVTNLTDEDYWSSYWQLGIARSVALSMKMEF
ncbi:MAG: TonB-dependent receptor [Cellvibrio sp.]|uniref:TonB-dependent siderophore receptor n=1 Tax=Cellvibrio sp. TaxID=1965322 RepID=UPI0031B24911